MRGTFDRQRERKITANSLIGIIAIALTVSSCSNAAKTTESASDKAQAAESEKASASGSEMIMIFDGTDNKVSEPETANLENLFKSTIYPAAKKYWESDDASLEFEVDPESEHSIEGVAEGSFTESGKSKRLYSIDFLRQGMDFAPTALWSWKVTMWWHIMRIRGAQTIRSPASLT